MQPAEEEEEKISALKIFLMSLRSPESKRTCQQKLRLFINDFLKLPGSTLEEQCEAFVELANKNGVKWVLHRVYSYRAYYEELIEQDKIEASTVDNYLNAIKSFCDKNDDSMPVLPKSKWTIIKAGLPRRRIVADVRAPTVEEIRELLKYWDPRTKPLVLTFVSSGIRHQAWAYRKGGKMVYLRWGDVERIPKDETLPVEAAKVTVYNDEIDEEYDAHITPEAYNALKEWMKYRESYGEVITPESYLMRDLWKTTNIKRGAKRSLAQHPNPIGPDGIKTIIQKGWFDTGVREPLPKGEGAPRRHAFKLMHGFRMFFSSTAEDCLDGNRDIVKLLLGQENPLDESYRDPKAKEKMILKHYLKCVPELTINDVEKSTLQKKVTELTQKTQDNEQLQKRVVELEVQNQKNIEFMRAELNAHIERSDRNYSELIARLEANRKKRQLQQQEVPLNE